MQILIDIRVQPGSFVGIRNNILRDVGLVWRGIQVVEVRVLMRVGTFEGRSGVILVHVIVF